MCVCIYIYKHWPTLKITYPGVGIEGESGESVRTPTLMMADFLWLCSLGLAPPWSLRPGNLLYESRVK